ncbi:hypothetical protein P7K49_004031 [Saguinus oedipus]|uniref:Uncharacterized protein n=1 Tax=Saguinus oedipus TaxID=9490 RepID=A0ABQ9W6N4_SAGOE|nr:hypothetical protein P7K49_004031 [Saguinus oedipus]
MQDGPLSSNTDPNRSRRTYNCSATLLEEQVHSSQVAVGEPSPKAAPSPPTIQPPGKPEPEDTLLPLQETSTTLVLEANRDEKESVRWSGHQFQNLGITPVEHFEMTDRPVTPTGGTFGDSESCYAAGTELGLGDMLKDLDPRWVASQE